MESMVVWNGTRISPTWDVIHGGRASEPGAKRSEAWQEADAALRRIAKQRAALEAEEAHWLLRARDAAVHEHLGYATFLEYLERVLGWGPHTALERLRVAEALVELPAMSAAMAAGELCFSAARELTRVATAETETAWLDAAKDRTLKEIQPLVSHHRPGDLPDDPAQPGPSIYKLRYEVAPETHALLREAFDKIRNEAGCAMTDDEVLAQMARAVLGGPDEGTATHQIAITVCPDCDKAQMQGGGDLIEVAPEVFEQACCDAVFIGDSNATEPERATQNIPPAKRRLVIHRDHGRCVVPGCRSKRYLQIHHIHWRSNGGDHDIANLCLLCGAHHARLHHGRLKIEGEAPNLTFFHADGRPYGKAPAQVSVTRFEDALSALTNLGWRHSEARAALDAATSHVGPEGDVTDLVRAGLKELARLV